MISAGKTYLVMGLLDPDSLAYAIGRTLADMGGRVLYTVQNDVLKRRFLDRAEALTEAERRQLDFRFCDVTDTAQVQALFATTGPLAGLVHSIAYANPRTLLGEELHTDAVEDIKQSHQVSCVSLATVMRYAQPVMPDGGAVVALSFDTSRVYPYYNWMGVQKAALEALVRALARRHGRDRIRVNAVSAGPLETKAASKIPGFGSMTQLWRQSSPLSWDVIRDKQAVAHAVAFLLSPFAEKITGQTLYVDGGASIMAGPLLDFERPAPAPR